jgi:hypothetical protein
MNRIVLTLLSFCFISSVAVAQIGFKYQGIARNAQNAALVSQNITLRLTILNGATPVYLETHATKTSDLGIFNVNVCGGTNPTGNCATIDWSTGNYQLKVELDPAGGTSFLNMGNSPILAVPIASYATKAGSVPSDLDQSPTNEIQQLSFNATTNKLSLSQSSDVDLTVLKNDADFDPKNEIQKISLDTSNNEVFLSNGGGSFLLPSSGANLWKKTGNMLSYVHTASIGITHDPGKFELKFGPTSSKTFFSTTAGWGEEYRTLPTNANKTTAYGSEVQEYPVTLARHFLRFNTDTFFRATSLNYVFQPGASPGIQTNIETFSQAVGGNSMPVRVLSTLSQGSGGIGMHHALLGGRLSATTGNLTINGTLTPFVGIWNVNQQNIYGTFFNAGKASVIAEVKNFVVDYPNDASKQIWYACVEGPEVAAYQRGTGELVNGVAEIPFPKHFTLLVDPKSITIQLTPNSAESEGLAVIEKTSTGFKVKELRKGNGTYSFDWEVKAVRLGYENFEPVRPRMKIELPTNEPYNINSAKYDVPKN